jgi:uncharacterized protein (TIGR02271 family)
MESTIIGVYDEYAQAQNAINALVDSGIARNDIALTPQEQTSSARQLALRSDHPEGEHATKGVGHFFRSLFGLEDSENRADVYSEAVRRGSYLLSVQSRDDDQHAEIMNIMNRFTPVDIDERAAHWRNQGWSSYDHSAPILSEAETERDRQAYAIGQTPLSASQQTTSGAALASGSGSAAASETTQPVMQTGAPIGGRTGETHIPVVEEELQVGKREVQRGGIRIYQHVVETPVHESVQLREEHVRVERHSVDHPATEADLAAFKENEIELRENVEEPVVAKTAHVVEEVVVGKDVSERMEDINDTVRHTDVEIEQLGAAGASGQSQMPIGSDADYRTHWQTAYGSSSGRYEDYAPAYSYGSSMAGDARYGNRQWTDVEPQLRSDWEARHPGSTWEKVKDAVRYGVERTTEPKP